MASPRTWARLCAAALCAGLGIATLAGRAGVPDGLAHGSTRDLLKELLGQSAFWTSLAIGALLASLLLFLTIHLLARAHGLSPSRSLNILTPMAYGAALPIAAWLLDPWWFWSAAPPLAAAGIGWGLISSHQRFRQATMAMPRTEIDARFYVLGLLTLAILLPTLMVSPGPPWWTSLSGDEPHYLVGARSIWVDQDVDLANDYHERLYWGFYPGRLPPHTKEGVEPGTLYSIHGIGLSVWLAPWFAAGQSLSRSLFTLLVRCSMTLWLGAFAVVLFLLLRDIAGHRPAVLGTLLAILTAPLLFAGPHLFPEVPALTLSAAAYMVLRRSPQVPGALLAGALLAFLPWLHFKFFALMAAVAGCGAWILLRGAGSENRKARSRFSAVFALAGPILLTGLGHLLFTWHLYGRLSPLAISVGAVETAREVALGDDPIAYVRDPLGALQTGIGLFFDQKEGLLFYAPHYLLAAAGLAWLWRRRRADAVALVVCLLSLWIPYSLSQEPGHWSPPARPLTAVVWTLAVPMGIGVTLAVEPGRRGKAMSALRGVLIAWGGGMTLLLIPQSELLYHDHNIAQSLLLLRYSAPGLSLPALAPLWFFYQEPQWAVSIIWLAAAVLVAGMLWRWGQKASIAAGEPAALAPEDVETVQQPRPEAGEAMAVGHTAARGFVVVVVAALLLHHFLVPVSALYRRHTNGPVKVHVRNIPQERAWHSAGGTWIGGDDSVELLISIRRPVDTVELQIEAISTMDVEVQLGKDRKVIGLDAGEPTALGFEPGPDRAWDRWSYYHFLVVAPGGTTPAALGGNRRDLRTLGVLVRFLEDK